MRGLMRGLRSELKAHGVRGLIRRRGWRFVAVVIAVYLVRDVVLYVVIPMVVAVGLSR